MYYIKRKLRITHAVKKIDMIVSSKIQSVTDRLHVNLISHFTYFRPSMTEAKPDT